MLLIETHVREQEEAAELADAKVAEYEAERTKLLHEAEADAAVYARGAVSRAAPPHFL